MRPAPLGGNCERRKIPSPWEPPSLAGKSGRTDRELQKLKRRVQSWLTALQDKERPAQTVRDTSPHFPAPEAHLLTCTATQC